MTLQGQEELLLALRKPRVGQARTNARAVSTGFSRVVPEFGQSEGSQYFANLALEPPRHEVANLASDG